MQPIIDMTTQQRKNKIIELEQWLQDNPNHEMRTTIESDLRKLKDSGEHFRTYERDTFDITNYNIK